jgi:hypothetical protein
VTRDEFIEKIKKGLGSPVHLDARKPLGDLIRNRSQYEIFLENHWVRNRAFWKWTQECEEIEADWYSGGYNIKLMMVGDRKA